MQPERAAIAASPVADAAAKDTAANTILSYEQRHDSTLLTALEAEVAAPLLARKLAGDAVRVWLPDCGGGELAYGVAAVLQACAEQHAERLAIQIFATDTDANALASARRGRYSESLAWLLPAKHLARFFLHEHQHYQAKPAVRQLITFAQLDVLRDPPFAHLDLIVCRDMFGALPPETHEQIALAFHWCLQPHGVIMLESEESPPYLAQLFECRHTSPGIFSRRDAPTARPFLPRYPPPDRLTLDQQSQSVGEHLLTVNQVLRHKVAELGQANADLNNLIGATDLAIVFLDRRLQITRCTPQAAALFNLIPTDRGRPLAHIHSTLEYERLVEDAGTVLANLQTIEHEVRSTNGGWYLVRLRPYRAEDERIAGVVLVCLDISARRLAEAEVRRARDELELRVIERTEELSTANAQLTIEIAERARLEQERIVLMRQLVTTQEDERRHIARELHDQLGQSISALNLGLSFLDSPQHAESQRRQMLERMRQIVAQIDQEVNRMSLDLRPMLLDDLGLVEALQQHVEEWAARTGVAADFQLIERAIGRPPRELESVLYRVIQEALTNVAKHAAASNVSVILERRHDRVRAIVEDDGRGFDPEALLPNVQRRLGLVGMRERVALVGGSLTLESEPGAGTTLFVEIPIPLKGE